MNHQWHDVLIVDDEGDKAFSDAAPLLLEALEIVSHTRMLHFSLGVDCLAAGLQSVKDDRFTYRAKMGEAREMRSMMASLLDSVHDSFSTIMETNKAPQQTGKGRTTDYRSLLRCDGGLIAPRSLKLKTLLIWDPAFSYKTFFGRFNRLCQ
ncbi:unnamed protein product, partial [Trypanosoma congolense IL3000]